MPNVGITELIIVLVILLLIFGPKRLPGLGRAIGGGMREFKDSITGRSKDEEEPDANAAARDALPPAEQAAAPTHAESVHEQRS